MNNKLAVKFLLPIVILLLFVMFFATLYLGRIPENPPGTTGNTAGNLNNKGLFCEENGTVYFSNAYDNGSLYAMNSDETNSRKLAGIKIESLNVAGNYLYYYQADSSAASGLGSVRSMTGVYRSTLKGTQMTCFNKDPAQIVSLIENHLYYQHYDASNGMALYRQDLDRKNPIEIAKQIINPASSQNGLIYFNGVEKDHNLYSLNLSDHSMKLILERSVWNPIIQDDFIYFMDVSYQYRLCRYQISTNEIQVLTEDRIDFFNVSENAIYYQVSSTTVPALKRMALDGSNIEIVDEGIFEQINITSQYVYYNEFDNPVPVFKTPLLGPVNVTTFDSARDAAFASAN